MTVAITCLDLTEADLRAAAARTQDARASRRMLAIALLLEGWSRESAAEACAMDRQTLRDWVHPMPLGWPGCTTRHAATGHCLAFQANKGPRWRNGWRKVLISRETVWSAGVASICSSGSSRNLLLNCTSARSANCCASCRSAVSRCGHSIRKVNPRSRWFSKPVCRSHNRRAAR